MVTCTSNSAYSISVSVSVSGSGSGSGSGSCSISGKAGGSCWGGERLTLLLWHCQVHY